MQHSTADTGTLIADEIHTPYLTVGQVAARLSVSEMTVTRIFAEREGVLNLGTSETMHKRKRSLLRIPRWAFDKFITEKENTSRHSEPSRKGR